MFTPIMIFLREIILMEGNAVMAVLSILLVMRIVVQCFMRESGFRIKRMGKECFNIIMVKSTQGNERKINAMELANIYILIMINIKAIG